MSHLMALGDSQTQGYWDERGQGWFGRLREMIALQQPMKWGFTNLAHDGSRTHDVVHTLAQSFMRDPSHLIIAIGENDVIRWGAKDGPTDQHPEARHEAWDKVLRLISSMGIPTLVLLTRPVPDEYAAFEGYEDKPLYYLNTDLKNYNADIASWCKREGVPVLDVWEDWMKLDRHDVYAADKVHHNGQGHQLLAEQVYAKLQQLEWL